MSVDYIEKILLVDDEPNLLAALKRHLRVKFNITTAESGQAALQMIEKDGPYAVIVSDMRMPEMNGIQFLVKASKLCPDTVRMMLTGNSDLETAMHAVNEGNIFRFLAKPCQQETMQWALADGIKQYRLVTAEKELLEKTLKGSLRVMIDLFELASPVAFSKSSRIKSYMRQVAESLGVLKVWEFELAGLLSQIGCIAIPADTLEKVYSGETLSKDEETMYSEHPQLAEKLLIKIPRLERVANMIGKQLMTLDEYDVPGHMLFDKPELIGGLSLRAVMAFDMLTSKGYSKIEAIGKLKEHGSEYHSTILKAIETLNPIRIDIDTRIMHIRDLSNTMVLAEDIRTTQNVLIAAAGQQVTTSMRALLKNYQARGIIAKNEVQVYIPGVYTTQKAPASTFA